MRARALINHAPRVALRARISRSVAGNEKQRREYDRGHSVYEASHRLGSWKKKKTPLPPPAGASSISISQPEATSGMNQQSGIARARARLYDFVNTAHHLCAAPPRCCSVLYREGQKRRARPITLFVVFRAAAACRRSARLASESAAPRARNSSPCHPRHREEEEEKKKNEIEGRPDEPVSRGDFRFGYTRWRGGGLSYCICIRGAGATERAKSKVGDRRSGVARGDYVMRTSRFPLAARAVRVCSWRRVIGQICRLAAGGGIFRVIDEMRECWARRRR